MRRFKDFNHDHHAHKMTPFNYFTIWMGAVHNIPNYAMVGGFLALGISPLMIFISIMLSALFIACFLTLNGIMGSHRQLDFSQQLQMSFGQKGALFPGILRGIIVSIMWYGLQIYAGAEALNLILKDMLPSIMRPLADVSFLGMNGSLWIAFLLFWLINIGVGYGGERALNKITMWIPVLVLITFVSMSVWALSASGGFDTIMSYRYDSGLEHHQTLFVSLCIILNAMLSVWIAPISSVSDFTQHATSSKGQIIGQFVGILTAHVLFAFASLTILIGGSVYLNHSEWQLIDIIQAWDHQSVKYLAIGVLILTTLSTNVTSNIIPTAYQLKALTKHKLSYRTGVIVASLVCLLIMPWKMMAHSQSIFTFLNIIGAFLGPVVSILVIDTIRFLKGRLSTHKRVPHYEKRALTSVIIGIFSSLIGFVPLFEALKSYQLLLGLVVSSVIYTMCLFKRKKEDSSL
ncbi:cytosine permease [Staphylococcus massiliensis]|uniref:Allantoin permease n=1 Tax=Staphylococcus massiliensis S46 TaxID=1229783 RepID=K9AHR4_9STAP|nr:cytosine permease [Staphylococcus massiliensis]EKU46814.1 allantoin permease [Staphylococcus massiliensis S46]MCG3399272.1 cytosine permease [Staphylococcus massiliensis]MCG3402342.1 cytosine permease [Staphylococcus massiliensis]MCG3411691.1 cytosine permease [Staphylococcus massiliensis]POA01708.1 allantoin permease [Staphylococcus massiliensis CCUG 55927]